MSTNNVHPIFHSIFQSFGFVPDDPNPPNDTIPTSEGDRTIPEIMDHLTWCSYKANRGYGCSHESLVRIGIGTEAMRLRYDQETTK